MQASNYIKNLNTFKSLTEDNLSGRLFHAIMLINADEEFLMDFAKLLSADILADGGKSRDVVLSNVIKEVHPDLYIYGKEKAIDVSVARDIVSDVFVAPYEGTKKVYIINKFDEIQASVANKLLKTIEEPPKGVVFLLLVKNDSRVLQTLLSRSQKFYLEGYSSGEVSAILKDRGIQNSELLSVLSGNNLTVAEKLAKQADPFKMSNFIFSVFNNLKITTDLIRFVSEAESFRESARELLSFFATVAEQAIRCRAGKKIDLSGELANQVVEISKVWNYKALVGIIDATLMANKMLDANVGQTNVLDQFFLKVLEVRRKCRV